MPGCPVENCEIPTCLPSPMPFRQSSEEHADVPQTRSGILHVQGVRTIVLPPDAPECETLHEPWRSSGIMLAPLIFGYSTVYFPYGTGDGGGRA